MFSATGVPALLCLAVGFLNIRGKFDEDIPRINLLLAEPELV